MNTLTSKDNKGLGTLAAARLGDPEFKMRPEIFRATAVREKAPITYKARLCARGDILQNTATEDAPPPTAARCAPRNVTSISLPMRFQIGIVDV